METAPILQVSNVYQPGYANVQPPHWGERTRARLAAFIAAAKSGNLESA